MNPKLADYEAALIAADKAGNADDARLLAQKVMSLRVSQPETFDPTEGMSGGQKFLAGVGKGVSDVGTGIGQIYAGVADTLAPRSRNLSDLVTGRDPSRAAAAQSEVNEERRLAKPLMDTGAGTAGNIAGSLAAALPTLAIPGANTVAGAALVGGGFNALQPVGEGESRLKNAALGAALGGGAQYGLGKLAGYAGNKLAAAEATGITQQSQNSIRDATLKAAQEAGYVVPPSQAGAGIASRVLEGISGKFKTNQAAGIKNQNVTDRLARQALGLSDDTPITREAMQEVRNRAFQRGYEPVANAGAVETDITFKKALDNIVQDYQGAARSFPGGVKNDVMKRIDGLRTGSFDTGDALKMTRILRDEANTAYAAGDKALGKATKQASNAIEDQVERALQGAGKGGAEMLKEFQMSFGLLERLPTTLETLPAFLSRDGQTPLLPSTPLVLRLWAQAVQDSGLWRFPPRGWLLVAQFYLALTSGLL
jgi:hypothetical protein